MSDSNKRNLKRSPVSLLNQRASCKLSLNNQNIELDVVDFQFGGACLTSTNNLPTILTVNSMGTLDFYIGKKMVNSSARFRIAWVNHESRKIGLKFEGGFESQYERVEDRFATAPEFAPTIVGRDPLDPNRFVFFSVKEFSSNGLGLICSLTNRHLLPGMTIKDARLNFPNSGQTSVSIEIRDVRHSDNDKIRLGCKVLETGDNYFHCLQQYLNLFGPLNEDSTYVRKLFASGLVTKKIKGGMTFEAINTENQYSALLDLRFRGYKKVNKIVSGEGLESQGDGLENEGYLGGAYLRGKLVGSFELRFGSDNLKFRSFSFLTEEQKRKLINQIDINRTVEISKLVVDPDYHGTDLVLGIMQKMINIVVAKGEFSGLITATEKLVPLYEKVGFQAMEFSVPHPILDTNLVYMRMDFETFANAKGLNPIIWDNIYRLSHQSFVETGIVDEIKFNWRQKLFLMAGRGCLWIRERVKSGLTQKQFIVESQKIISTKKAA